MEKNPFIQHPVALDCVKSIKMSKSSLRLQPQSIADVNISFDGMVLCNKTYFQKFPWFSHVFTNFHPGSLKLFYTTDKYCCVVIANFPCVKI